MPHTEEAWKKKVLSLCLQNPQSGRIDKNSYEDYSNNLGHLRGVSHKQKMREGNSSLKSGKTL